MASSSTLTDRGQTTVPAEIRELLKLKPRQQLDWHPQPDGSAVVRAKASVMDLFGSLKTARPFPGIAEEERAGEEAWAADAMKDGKQPK
jgi:antitoxin PrlF